MKPILTIFVLLILIGGGCSKLKYDSVDISKTLERNGIRYLIQSDGTSNEPFNGVVITNYENGQLRYKKTFKYGKLNGLYEHYYGNGQLRNKGTYKDGNKNGLFIFYNDNNQLMSRGTYKDGKLIDSKPPQ